MENKLRVLYYRGVSYTAELLSKTSNKLRELTYRGVPFISKESEKIESHSTLIYRGANR
jgi:hypothetical protein